MKLIKDLGCLYPKKTSKQKYRYGLYECPLCKNPYKAMTYHVNRGNSTKCKSCAAKEMITHNSSHTRLYRIWKNMKQRCYNPNKDTYKYYGGNNVKVCDEWRNSFNNFKKWASVNGYSQHLTIHRMGDNIDGNGGDYTPNNCCWATDMEQHQATKRIRKNNKSGYRGVSWSSRRKHWIVQIMINKKSKYLGSFCDKKEGALVYDKYILDNKLSHTKNFHDL